MSRMQTFYIQERGELAMFGQQASPAFWEQHWQQSQPAKIVQNTWSSIFSDVVKKNLPKGARLLEAGSGSGNVLCALSNSGYNVVGLDFVPNTMVSLKQERDSLPLVLGDVRRLPFTDASFDGCVSGGVIEHFWEGYEEPLREAHRVLRPSGVLFLTFPNMSLLRRLKASLGFYTRVSRSDLNSRQGEFYQFVLDSKSVRSFVEHIGFSVVEMARLDGIKGFKDECPFGRRYLQMVYDRKTGSERLRNTFDRILCCQCSHLAQLVCVKRA